MVYVPIRHGHASPERQYLRYPKSQYSSRESPGTDGPLSFIHPSGIDPIKRFPPVHSPHTTAGSSGQVYTSIGSDDEGNQSTEISRLVVVFMNLLPR